MNPKEELENVIRTTFEKHQVNNTALENALADILDYALNNKQHNSSEEVLSEKIRDKPTNG